MLNALLIGNPASGSGHRLADVRVPGRWLLEPAAVTAEDLAEVDLVALFGGDGTMQITLSQILGKVPADQLPPVAIMPFGTTNMNAKGLNRARGRKAAVASLAHAVETGRFESQVRGLVRVTDGADVQHGFFFGIGVIARVVEQWNEERKPGALANQLRSLWAMINGLRTISSTCSIVLNGAAMSVYGLLATTLDRLLFGSRPYWGPGEPGALRLTWVEADAAGLVRRAPELLRGRDSLLGTPGYESLAIDQATLALSGPYIVDGEIFHPTGRNLTINRSEPIRWITL